MLYCIVNIFLQKSSPDFHIGVSTNDFEEALRALFGESVKGLSAASVAQLKGGCELEYARRRGATGEGVGNDGAAYAASVPGDLAQVI